MRLSKAVREQQAAQCLITTLCVWDVEQRWDLDAELAFAWDQGRFDDPYRRVLLPQYPPTRQGVCTALATQFGRPVDALAAQIATGTVFPEYAKPWDVSIDSLGKLTALVRFDGYGTRLWRVAEGTLDLRQAYREQTTDHENRTEAQQQAYTALRALEGQLHPDDATEWISRHFTNAGYVGLGIQISLRLPRYRLLRKCWDAMLYSWGAAEQTAFAAYVAADMARRKDWPPWPWNRHAASAVPACFQALGLAWPCTLDDVKHAYRTLAFTAHPDAGGSEAAFGALAEAYEAALKWLERVEQTRGNGR